jgi:hypothetical protein
MTIRYGCRFDGIQITPSIFIQACPSWRENGYKIGAGWLWFYMNLYVGKWKPLPLLK